MTHDDQAGEWPDLDALWRFARGVGQEVDNASVRQWLGGGPNARPVERGLRAFVQESDALAARYDADAAEQRLRTDLLIVGVVARHQQSARQVIEQPKHRAGRIGSDVAGWRLGRAAVAAAVVAVCVWGAWSLTAYRALAPAPLTVVSTHAGEVRRLALPDGSQIVLGPETTARYQAGGGRGPREVWLDGEAHFAVAGGVGRRLRVYAGHGSAEDVGTTFTVRAYSADSLVRVVVIEGAVMLRPRGDVIRQPTRARMLQAGELGQLGRDGEIRGARVNTDRYAAWTRDTLAFEDASLAEVASQLRRWFGVDVAVDAAVATRTLTGSFSRSSLLPILDATAAATDAQYERRGGRVVFSAR